jgi:hypothetical protein
MRISTVEKVDFLGWIPRREGLRRRAFICARQDKAEGLGFRVSGLGFYLCKTGRQREVYSKQSDESSGPWARRGWRRIWDI